MARYRLMSGAHQEGGVTYHKGDTITTDRNLSSFNSPNSIKFRKLKEPLPAPSPDYDEMETDEGVDADAEFEDGLDDDNDLEE